MMTIKVKLYVALIITLFPYYSSADIDEKFGRAYIEKIEAISTVTVRIEADTNNNEIVQGTGFLFKIKINENSWRPFLVTNRHVINNTVRGRFKLYVKINNKYTDTVINVDNFEQKWIKHPDKTVDLAALPLDLYINNLEKKNIEIKSAFMDTYISEAHTDKYSIAASDQILMIGYPLGIWDEVNNYPVFRRGITATNPKLDYNGKKEFLIDMACFPGSSGSPIFLDKPLSDIAMGYGRIFRFIGILYAGPQYSADGSLIVVDVPTKLEKIPKINIPTNLGYVIKAEVLIDFLKKISVQ